MLKIDGWLFATLIFQADVFICNTTKSSSSTTSSTSPSTNTTSKTPTNTISTDDSKGTATLCTTAGTTNYGSTMTSTSTTTYISAPTANPFQHTIINIGIIAVVAVVVIVVLVAACYYRRRRSRKRTKAGNTDNLNVRPSLESDNQMPKTMHSDANAVYASVPRMRPSQSITQSNIMINTMERMPDSTYNQTSELLDDTYDSTITCGKITLDDTYDHTNFKTSYYSTCDTYDNTNYTHDNIYDTDAQQAMNDFEPTYEFTLNNVNGETNDEPFQLPRENVDEIYNNM